MEGSAFWLSWLYAYLVTIAVEVTACLLILGRLSRKKVVGAALLCSTLTHPLLWWAYSRTRLDYWTFVAVGEAAVVLAETGVLWAVLRLTPRRALGMSLTMNSASYLVGLAVF